MKQTARGPGTRGTTHDPPEKADLYRPVWGRAWTWCFTISRDLTRALWWSQRGTSGLGPCVTGVDSGEAWSAKPAGDHHHGSCGCTFIVCDAYSGGPDVPQTESRPPSTACTGGFAPYPWLPRTRQERHGQCWGLNLRGWPRDPTSLSRACAALGLGAQSRRDDFSPCRQGAVIAR